MCFDLKINFYKNLLSSDADRELHARLHSEMISILIPCVAVHLTTPTLHVGCLDDVSCLPLVMPKAVTYFFSK